MKHLMADIAELHEAFDHPVRLDGHVCNDFMNAESSVVLQQRLMLRLRLVAEEFFELMLGAVGLGSNAGEQMHVAKGAVNYVLHEWKEGYDYNAVLTADALTDLMVVIVGMALELGIPLDRTWAEVHRSNMAKAQPTWWCEKCDCHTEDHDKACVYCGNKVYVQKMVVKKRVDGKVLKPEGWTKPDIEGALKSEVTAERLKESAVLDIPPKHSMGLVAAAIGLQSGTAQSIQVELKKNMLRKAIVSEAVRVTRMVDDGKYSPDDVEAHRRYIRLLCRELDDLPGLIIDDAPGT